MKSILIILVTFYSINSFAKLEDKLNDRRKNINKQLNGIEQKKADLEELKKIDTFLYNTHLEEHIKYLKSQLADKSNDKQKELKKELLSIRDKSNKIALVTQEYLDEQKELSSRLKEYTQLLIKFKKSEKDTRRSIINFAESINLENKINAIQTTGISLDKIYFDVHY